MKTYLAAIVARTEPARLAIARFLLNTAAAIAQVSLQELSWSYHELDNDDVHVVPNNDLIEHALNEECLCGPRCEAVPRGDGTIGWMYSHASLDGREAREAAA